MDAFEIVFQSVSIAVGIEWISWGPPIVIPAVFRPIIQPIFVAVQNGLAIIDFPY